jgi:hypothetical protein
MASANTRHGSHSQAVLRPRRHLLGSEPRWRTSSPLVRPNHHPRKEKTFPWIDGGLRHARHMDARRSAVAYQACGSLVDVKYIYGHESVDMATQYIEPDLADAARGLSAFGVSVKSVLTQIGA